MSGRLKIYNAGTSTWDYVDSSPDVLSATKNTDGLDISGGITSRKLTLSGGDISIAGGGTNTMTIPAASDTLVGRASTDTLTNKSISGATNTLASISSDSLNQHYAVGTISGSASGSVTGLAFKPKIVEFKRLYNGAAQVETYGVACDNGGSIANYGQGSTNSGVGSYTNSTNSLINPTGNGTTNVVGAVTAFNSDGFTFTMSAAAAVNYLYIARG